MTDTISDEWRNQAKCKDLPADQIDAIFFPDQKSRTSLDKAQKICSQCPVRRQCLNYAINNKADYGYWGGASENQRINIRRQRNRALNINPYAGARNSNKTLWGVKT